MLTPAFSTPASFTAPQPPKGEGDMAAKAASVGDAHQAPQSGDGAKAQGESTTDFAAVLAATRPQAGQGASAGKLPQASAETSIDAALTELSAKAKALIAAFESGPGVPELSDMVRAFGGLLQDFDAATGQDTFEALVFQINLLDAAGLANLDAVRADPAALFAALAALAGVPLGGGKGQAGPVVALPQPGKAKGEVAMTTPVVSRREGNDVALLPRTGMTPPPEETLKGPLMPAQQAVAGHTPQDAGAVVRSAVLTALAAAGAEAEVPPASMTQADLRAPASSAADALRPAVVMQPPATNFARNLAQQIRAVSFSEGNTRISLAPRGLGEIEIDMRPDEAGKLRIVLRAENPAVLFALRGDRDGLLLTLSESGTDIRDADLSFEDFGNRQRQDADPSNKSGHQSVEFGTDDITDSIAVPRRRVADGILDMLT